MQFSTFVSVVAALGLSASVAAIPEPAVRDISDMQKRAATECGMNEHQPERCPEGAECNCVIQNMVRRFLPGEGAFFFS